MRQLLKNAKIYDGTGSAPFSADILLEDDRIARIAEGIDLPADRVIDLQGKSVAPGFIDGHSHNDWFAIKKAPLPSGAAACAGYLPRSAIPSAS